MNATIRSPGLTRAERALIRALRTPAAVQAWLNALDYNVERGGETLRSFRGVVRTQSAHCLEAALFAAVVLEQHGYPPLVMSLESQDNLDHVIFVYRTAGRLGIGRALARPRLARPQAGVSPPSAGWPTAMSSRTSTTPAASAVTASPTWPRRWAATTGGGPSATCGRWSGC